MPPKITDSRPSPDAVHAVEEQTAAGARRIVATYAEDFFDGVTLMSMLGVEPRGFVYKKYAEEREAEGETEAAESKKTTKKATKKASKKSTKKATKKKSTKKTTKKATKKKTTKKTTKKAAKKASTDDKA